MGVRDIPAGLKARKVAGGGRQLGWPKRILDGPRACVGKCRGMCANGPSSQTLR